MNERDKRVMDFLRTMHGQDPTPLRCYLTNEEARTLTSVSAIGRAVAADLDTAGYAGKWRQAVESQIRREDDPQDWEFWLAARLVFFEYGGCYRPEMAPSATEAFIP